MQKDELIARAWSRVLAYLQSDWLTGHQLSIDRMPFSRVVSRIMTIIKYFDNSISPEADI